MHPACPVPVTSFDLDSKPREVIETTDPNHLNEGFVVSDVGSIPWILRGEAFDKDEGRCFLPCRVDTIDVETLKMTTAGTVSILIQIVLDPT